MSLIKIEFYKLWKRKMFLIFLFLILLINVSTLAYKQNLDSNISSSAYQKLQLQLETIPNEQRFAFIEEYYKQIEGFSILQQLSYLSANPQENQDMIESIHSQYPDVEEKYRESYYTNKDNYYTANLESEAVFIKDVYSKMCLLKQYPMYLEDIQTKAKTISSISIFQSNDDISKNKILKSAQDYQNCSSVEITYDIEQGLQEALSFPVTNFLIMVTIFIIISYVIFEEKESGLFTIIRTTPKGSLTTILIKILVIFISVGIITLILITSNLIYMYFTCGLGDLNRSIQSISSYRQCTYLLSVKEYLLIYFMIKWLAVFLIGIMMLWVSLFAKNKVLAFAIILSFIFIELICYLYIQPLDSLYLFKYLNIISMLTIEAVFQYYYNVNLFNMLVSLQSLILSCLVISCIIFFSLCVFTYHRKRNMMMTPFELPKIKIHKKVTLSLWKQEWYKIWWLQKGLLFIIVAIIFQCYQFNQINIYRQNDELIMLAYTEKLSGPLTSEKETLIKNEQQRFLELHDQLEIINENYQNGIINKQQLDLMQDEYESQLASEPVFQKVLEQYQRIIDDPQIEFVVPYGYQQLFSSESWGLLPAIFIIIFALLSLSNVFIYDYQRGVNKIIVSTVKGMQKYQSIKIVICMITCLILMLTFYLPGYLKLNAAYGINNWSASIRSLDDYLQLPNFSILTYFIICYLLKFLALLVVVFFMLAFSKRFKNQFMALFMTVVLFLVPLFLAYSGYHFLDSFSLYPLIMSDLYIKTDIGIIQIISSFIIYLAVFVSSCWYLVKPQVIGNKNKLRKLILMKF